MSKKIAIPGKPENHLVIFPQRVNHRPAKANPFEETSRA